MTLFAGSRFEEASAAMTTEPEVAAHASDPDAEAVAHPIWQAPAVSAPASPRVGDCVAYVPNICHYLDRDLSGNRVFDFEHVTNGPMRNGAPLYRQGDRVNLSQVGSLESSSGAHRDAKTGHLVTTGGHMIRPVAPRQTWKAVVLEVKEGGKLDLCIQHPHGHTLDYLNVPYAAKSSPLICHTWHPEGA